MRAKVTEAGVVVPKAMLGEAEEVEIVRENGRVLLVPVEAEDPILGLGSNPLSPEGEETYSIWDLGKNPIDLDDATDASENLDRYLYGSDL